MEGQKVNLANREPEPGEQGYTPPHDLVPLPSRGKVYPPESPLHMAESVAIRPMTAREEDILTSTALMKSGKVITTLLRSCLVSKGIDVDAMLEGDRNAVLVALRITGYGPEYKVQVTCPACGETVPFEFNLLTLPIKPLEVDPIEPGKNAFSCRLPSGRDVRFHLPTGHDEREISQVLSRTKKVGGQETPVTTRLFQLVESIAGESDRGRLATMVRDLPARDARFLRQTMNDMVPGIEMRQTFSCSHCSEETEVEVPLGAEFFWPSG